VVDEPIDRAGAGAAFALHNGRRFAGVGAEPHPVARDRRDTVYQRGLSGPGAASEVKPGLIMPAQPCLDRINCVELLRRPVEFY
jgi:hypothetical protein